jgi:hypothetical protein
MAHHGHRNRLLEVVSVAGVSALWDVRQRKGGTDDVLAHRRDPLPLDTLLLALWTGKRRGGFQHVYAGEVPPAKVATVANLPAWRMSLPWGRPLVRRAPAACSPGGVRRRHIVGMGSGIVPLAVCPRTSCFLLPAICAIKGTKGAPVPGPSPARLRERWRVSHDL